MREFQASQMKFGSFHGDEWAMRLSQRRIADTLHRMAATPGIESCALVHADSGYVWHESGRTPQSERLWEAAIDYWQLQARQREHFEPLGKLGAAVMHHAFGVLALVPCIENPDLLIVCVAGHTNIDWMDWQRKVRDLALLIQQPQT